MTRREVKLNAGGPALDAGRAASAATPHTKVTKSSSVTHDSSNECELESATPQVRGTKLHTDVSRIAQLHAEHGQKLALGVEWHMRHPQQL